LLAAVEPKLTPMAPVKLVPVIVTAVPPLVGPDLGSTLDTDGAAACPISYVGVLAVAVSLLVEIVSVSPVETPGLVTLSSSIEIWSPALTAPSTV
jgi:hypothetical protein